jgi:phytoene/squalene synthetase
MGILAFDKKFRNPIYSIYGFVRYADEIVDTFYGYDQRLLLQEFRTETYKAIERKISLNPVLDAFQQVVNQYNIDTELIDAFLRSMEMDLYDVQYQEKNYQEYIYGSAEVVGLMCLRVFCEGNDSEYQRLKGAARSLGAAFQKVNFLRDVKDDYAVRGRTYFPNVNLGMSLNTDAKKAIELDIQKDFDDALQGIKQLPTGAKMGVLIAYRFYLNLFKKICRTQPEEILEKRIRISNLQKAHLATRTFVKIKLNLL